MELTAANVTAATFELFNLFSQKPDWILDASAGETRVRLAGITHAPALPGPSELHVAYVDEPRGKKLVGAKLRVLRIDVARVSVEGVVDVEGETITLEIEAALVT
jgi:hypothetical protein